VPTPSRLRSRRLLYETKVESEGLSEREFEICFKRALAHGVRRARMSGGAGWLAKAVAASEIPGGRLRGRGRAVFRQYEVYVSLPEAVIPGRERNWLGLARFGWRVKEELPRKNEDVSEFFNKALEQWTLFQGCARVFGPGLNRAEALCGNAHEETEVVLETELEDGVAGSGGRDQASCLNACKIKRQEAGLWTREEIGAIAVQSVRDVLRVGSRVARGYGRRK
jgi:hypothetical protein